MFLASKDVYTKERERIFTENAHAGEVFTQYLLSFYRIYETLLTSSK